MGSENTHPDSESIMKYVAVLRGINVSGQKSIKMADLKILFESLGFENIQTYVQSGNVIFDSAIKSAEKLMQLIEGVIEKKYKFYVPVLIRSKNELKKIIDACPFGSVDLSSDGTKVLLTFLSSKPKAVNIKAIQEHVALPEQLIVQGKEVYLYCPNGYGKSKLSNNFLEKKLVVGATTRNWKSVCKLLELAS